MRVIPSIILLIILTLNACGGAPGQPAAQPTGLSNRQDTPTSSSSLSVLRYATLTPAVDRKPAITPTQTKPPQTSTLVPTLIPTLPPTPTPTSTPVFAMCSPISTVIIHDLPKIVSDPYRPPPPGSDLRHEGVDFAYFHWNSGGPIKGVPVQSVLPGKVAAALAGTFPYGNFVIVETPYENLPKTMAEGLKIPQGDSLYLLYAHLNDPPVVSLGELLESCQRLGAVGSSGNSGAPHLHLETRYGPPGAFFLGLSRFVKNLTPEEKENYALWRTSGVFQMFDPMSLLLFEIRVNR